MIRLLGLGIITYMTYKAMQEIENEKTDSDKEVNSSEKTNLNEKNLTLNIEKKKLDALREKAIDLQKEMSRLHELFLTNQKLTAAGNMNQLDIKVEGLSIEELINKKELKLNEILKESEKTSKKIENLKKS